MPKYELLVVLPGTLDDAAAEERFQGVAELVRTHGQDVELHPLGKNRLAYPINHIRYGYFHTIVFTADPVGVKALEQKLSLSREILRSMVTHFNTTLTAAQRIVYSTDSLGLTTMVERPGMVQPIAALSPVAMVEPAPKEAVESTVERKLDATSIEQISKKLEDLMAGDVITGV